MKLKCHLIHNNFSNENFFKEERDKKLNLFMDWQE